MAFIYLQRNYSPLGAHARPPQRNPLPLLWQLRAVLTLGTWSRLAHWWAYHPGHWRWRARHVTEWPGIKHLAENMFDKGYEYGVECCVTWITTNKSTPDLPGWKKVLIVADIERCAEVTGLPRMGGLTKLAADIIFDDPKATGKPGVLLKLVANDRDQAEPDASQDAPADPSRDGVAKSSRLKRDLAAPHGYGDDGKPLAPFGYRKDGRPRATKPRLSKPVAKPKQAEGTLPFGRDEFGDEITELGYQRGFRPGKPNSPVRRTLRRIANWLRRLPRRRAVRRARLAESVQRHPSGAAA